MGNRIAVLGCGRIGATLARDLASDDALEVTVFDASDENLRQVAAVARLTTTVADLSEIHPITACVEPFDVVVGALPSRLGHAALRAAIAAGKPCVDISFMIEDPRLADAEARRTGATVVYDCGVAPGLANICIGRSHAALDRLRDVSYYVGGLPRKREWPFEYKAPFAPADVIEEYTRPARLIEDGQQVVKPALSDPELIEFPGVGELEGFNTDGLRSMLDTIPAENLREKTLRYPGHRDLIRALAAAGFFSSDPVRAGGMTVRPLDVATTLLTECWRLDPSEPEFTVLRVVVEGTRGARAVRHTYDLFDKTDAATGTTSMARTTAFPCAIVARLLADGTLDDPGVHPPEWLGMQPTVFETIDTELRRRGVDLRYVETTDNS